jgi:signal transduction histidine kinase
MTPPSEWLRPPRSLLLALFLVTLVAVSALVWFSWRLLRQEQAVEAQRAQERLEQSADRIAATAREALAETGERLGSWVVSSPPDIGSEPGVLLIVSGAGLTAIPSQRLLYDPSLEPDPDASSDSFTDGETLEFQQGEPVRALESYRKLADSKNSTLRAGALMRMARVLRKSGRWDETRATYLQLAAITDARIAGAPAPLVARHALCELSGSKTDALELRADLSTARYRLTRGQFEFYWSETSRLAGDQAPVPPEPAALSAVVAQGWAQLAADGNPRGQRTVWLDGRPFFLIWRGAPNHRAILATRPEYALRQILAVEGTSSAAVDADGRIVAGHRMADSRAAVRTPAETQLPWTLYIASAQGFQETGLIVRQRFLLLVTGVTVLFVIAGACFIGRAVRRDLEVSRMQSDFVSAVSHEFRSPLTSIRQLSELLASGRIAHEGRRQVYYETLVKETTRLQRLIEGLLNFGRAEAGVRQYHFERLEAAPLVERVAAEFEHHIAGLGRHIELAGARDHCIIEADPEALSVALRNLVDNALKYSPDCPVVWVEWARQKQHVAISVRDKGPGIPASERRTIFRKFVRGSAAVAANVRGSGVGLAMVRHIVAAHGGAIQVASEPGTGSTFTILLPAGTE